MTITDRFGTRPGNGESRVPDAALGVDHASNNGSRGEIPRDRADHLPDTAPFAANSGAAAPHRGSLVSPGGRASSPQPPEGGTPRRTMLPPRRSPACRRNPAQSPPITTRMSRRPRRTPAPNSWPVVFGAESRNSCRSPERRDRPAVLALVITILRTSGTDHERPTFVPMV